MQLLMNYKQLTNTNFFKNGGLKIYTNLDMKATIMDDSIKNFKETADLQVATIAMVPNSGKIIALAGGTDYQKSI